MNEAYGGSAAGQGQPVDAPDGALLGRARVARDEPDCRPRDIRIAPHALTHRDKRFIAVSMMLPVGITLPENEPSGIDDAGDIAPALTIMVGARHKAKIKRRYA